MLIYLYSTQDILQWGGGGVSSSTTYKYLKKAGHDVEFFKSLNGLDKAIKKFELLLPRYFNSSIA